MKRSISAFLTLAILVGGFVGYQRLKPKVETYTLTADVEQAPNLFVGGRVMVRGVEVGEISDVEPMTDGVRLTLAIREGVNIPADATLSVIPVTVIADRYVQLFPAYKGGPTMADGDHIPAERTAIPAELDDVLTQLKGLLAALEPREGEKRGALARLVISLDRVFKGRADDLAGTLEGSATVLENLADSDANITGLIQNLDRLFLALANRSSELGLVNERFQLVAEALLGDQAELEGTTENLARLSDEVAGLLSESGDDIGRAFHRLGVVLDAVLAQQDQLIRGVKWANVISQALGQVDASGKGVHAYTGRQAPVGSAGASYNYRLDTRDTIACERLDALVESFKALNPNLTVEQTRESILTFIPVEYQDDLTFLIDLLADICAVFPGEEPSLDSEARQMVRALAAEIGERRFKALVVRWALTGSLGEAR